MKRVMVAALFLVGAACCPPAPPASVADGPKVDIQHMIDTTVVVRELDEEDPDEYSTCSGTWIGPREVLTAAHCVEGKGQVMYRGRTDGRMYRAWRKVVDEDVDLALLATEGRSSETVAVGENPAVGATVHITGHALGVFEWTYMRGYVSASRPGGIGGRTFKTLQLEMPVAAGDSGSAVFNDQGELVGVISYVIPTSILGPTQASGLSFAVHRDVVERFLKSARSS